MEQNPGVIVMAYQLLHLVYTPYNHRIGLYGVYQSLNRFPTSVKR